MPDYSDCRCIECSSCQPFTVYKVRTFRSDGSPLVTEAYDTDPRAYYCQDPGSKHFNHLFTEDHTAGECEKFDGECPEMDGL